MPRLATIKTHISKQPPVCALLIYISNTLQIFPRLTFRVLCVLPQCFSCSVELLCAVSNWLLNNGAASRRASENK